MTSNSEYTNHTELDWMVHKLMPQSWLFPDHWGCSCSHVFCWIFIWLRPACNRLDQKHHIIHSLAEGPWLLTNIFLLVRSWVAELRSEKRFGVGSGMSTGSTIACPSSLIPVTGAIFIIVSAAMTYRCLDTNWLIRQSTTATSSRNQWELFMNFAGVYRSVGKL